MNDDKQGELPIQYVLLALWRFRLVGIAVFLSCFLLGVLYLQTATPSYTVKMSVTAITQTSGQTNMLSTGLGLLGVAPQSEQATLFAEYLEGLHSTETARALLANPNLVHRVFPTEWSDAAGQWVEPSGFSVSIKKWIEAILGVPYTRWAPPNAQRVADYLQENVGIEQDKSSPVVNVSMVTPDPQLGLDVLNATQTAADNVLRQNALARTASYIGYLNNRLGTTTAVEYRQAIAETIIDQEKTRMKAASALPFSAEIFARPSVSSKPTKPAWAAVLIAASAIGLFLGVFAALLCNRLGVRPDFLRRRRPEVESKYSSVRYSE